MKNILGKMVIYKNKNWSKSIADLLNFTVRGILINNKDCSIILTGGKSAQEIYEKWFKQIENLNEKISFYIGDERMIEKNHLDSNYKMVNDLLNKNKEWDLHRVKTEINLRKSVFIYNKLLNIAPDILLLAIGDDGHIASIFPSKNNNYNTKRNFVLSKSNKHKYIRGTITPKFITKAKRIFIFVKGAKKGKLVNKMIKNPHNQYLLPGCLALSGTWLFDEAAYECLDR